MKHFLLTLAIVLSVATTVYSQQTDTANVPPAGAAMETTPSAAEPAPSAVSKVYYGGYVGATFGDYSSIELSPMVGYHVSPVVSAGVRFTYEYLWADVNGQNYDASNYGGSVFALARVHPKVFLQAEFKYMSYETVSVLSTDDREWVPFLYLGGGYVQPLGGNVSLVASVLVDVLQDENSPYEDWSPEFSIGVIAGF